MARLACGATGALALFCVFLLIDHCLAAPPAQVRIHDLIHQLGDRDFKVRETAAQALEAMGELALPELGRAAETNTDLEIRHRAKRIVANIHKSSLWIFRGHRKPVWRVAFGPDGKRALSASSDGTVRLLDLINKKQIREFRPHRQPVGALAFLPDGARVLSGGIDRTVCLWSTETGQNVWVQQGEAPVLALALSADAKTAVTGGKDGKARLWNVVNGKMLGYFPPDETAPAGIFTRVFQRTVPEVRAVALSRDGRLAVVGDADGVIHLWDMQILTERATFKAHEGGVWSLALSSSGSSVLSGGAEGRVLLWNVKTCKLERSFQGHAAGVFSVALSGDGKRALSGGADKALRLWDLAAVTELAQFSGHSENVLSVAFSPDSRYALSGGADHVVVLWKLP